MRSLFLCFKLLPFDVFKVSNQNINEIVKLKSPYNFFASFQNRFLTDLITSNSFQALNKVYIIYSNRGYNGENQL